MALLACLALAPNRAAAEEDMPYMRGGVPQPLPPEALVTHYRSSLLRGEHVLLDQALNEGDCEPLLQALESGDFYSPVLVDIWAELPDRGLCMPFDPERAARRFEATINPDRTPGALAILAWKYHYGHGVPHDPTRARELFIVRVMRLASWMRLPRTDNQANESLTELALRDLVGRPLPQEFLDGLVWTEQQVSTDAGMLALGKALIGASDLAYADGAPLPRHATAGIGLLRWVRDREAYYQLGLAELKGLIPGGNAVPLIDLEWAAYCGHAQAAETLALLHHSGEHALVPRDPDKAEMWRRVALSLGVAEADLFDPLPRHLQGDFPVGLEVELKRILDGRLCYLR